MLQWSAVKIPHGMVDGMTNIMVGVCSLDPYTAVCIIGKVLEVYW